MRVRVWGFAGGGIYIDIFLYTMYLPYLDTATNDYEALWSAGRKLVQYFVKFYCRVLSIKQSIDGLHLNFVIGSVIQLIDWLIDSIVHGNGLWVCPCLRLIVFRGSDSTLLPWRVWLMEKALRETVSQVKEKARGGRRKTVCASWWDCLAKYESGGWRERESISISFLSFLTPGDRGYQVMCFFWGPKSGEFPSTRETVS